MDRDRLLAFIALMLGIGCGLPGIAQAQSFTVTKTAVGGEGGHDYIVAEPGTDRLFVSRSSHVMVLDAATGKPIGDIADLADVHGIGLAPKWNHGFTTNRGDSTITMFDLRTLEPIRNIPAGVGGLDGIMYDAFTDLIQKQTTLIRLFKKAGPVMRRAGIGPFDMTEHLGFQQLRGECRTIERDEGRPGTGTFLM